MYSIICDARKGENKEIEILALVDRALNKDYWWTSDNPNIIMDYKKLSAAQFCVKRLNKNNPRIMETVKVIELIKEQREEIIHQEALESCELGWDGHKSIFQ